MDQMYLLTGSTSSYPTGTPIDSNSDGKVDGIDVNNDGLIDMKFVKPIGLPATGIDINNDGIADFYMYTTAAGTSFNMKADGSGATVSVIIHNGQLIGYDTNNDGVVDINVTGANVTYYSVGGNFTGVTSPIILSLTINNSSFEYLTICPSPSGTSCPAGTGTYTFTSNLSGGYFYSVAIASSTQQCNLTSPTTGVIAATSINNINITCGTLEVPVTIVWDGDTVANPTGPYPIGSMMLSLTVNNSTTEYLSLAAFNDNFTSHTLTAITTPSTFASRLNTGSFYSVMLVSSTDKCNISANTGTMPIVTPITIKCAKYTVGGTINPAPLSAALTSNMIISLYVNGTLAESKFYASGTAANTAFTFTNTKLYNLDIFEVRINTSQNCVISGNSGTISANYSGAAIKCGQYTVSGNITLSGAATTGNITIELQVISGSNVYTESKTLNGLTNPYNASYGAFNWKLLTGDQYSVFVVVETIGGVNCTPAVGATGTIAALNITTADVNCP